MVRNRIVTFFVSSVLIVFVAGCAAWRSGAELNPTDPAAAFTASQLSGTWRGQTWPVGGGSPSVVLNRDLTLEIKEDATYRLISARQGRASNDSGVAVPDGGAVILKSSGGQWIRLQRRGDTLHGVVTSPGRSPMVIMLERAP